MYESSAPSLRPSRKKFAATLAGVIGIVALLGLLLTMCQGQKQTTPSGQAANQPASPSASGTRTPAPPPAFEELPEHARARRIAEWRRAKISRAAAKRAGDAASERAAERAADRAAKKAAKRAALRNKKNRGDAEPKVAELENPESNRKSRLQRVDIQYPTAETRDGIVNLQTVPILPVLQWDHDKEEYPEQPH